MATPEAKGPGRPARISRRAIVEAASDVGLERLTLRAVAEHLDVSISSLYHHISGKDELLRLAAEHGVAQLPQPVDRGQHWAVWLDEWATYTYEAFTSRPGLLVGYLDGTISPETVGASLDRMLALMVRAGFDPAAAHAAYRAVTAAALGVVMQQMRDRSGGPTLPSVVRTVILGVAVERGEHTDTVVAALDRAALDRR